MTQPKTRKSANTENDADRLAIPLEPEEALRALMQVNPAADPASQPGTADKPCPKTWQGKPCILDEGHHGPCQYRL